MNKTIQITLPLWIPPMKYLGYELKKPYWIFTYRKGNSFMQVIYGLN